MNNPVDITPENSAANELAKLTRRAQSARMDIIVVVLFTVVNIALMLFGSLTYFLFSVSLPYYLCYFMSLYTGRMPAEVYGSEWDGFQFLPDGFFWSAVAVSVVVLAMYAVCFFASQNKKKNEDGSGFSVVAPDDLSVIRTYDTFIDSVETSRGTLYVYDSDGYVWTVDSDWNVLCRTTMNLTD